MSEVDMITGHPDAGADMAILVAMLGVVTGGLFKWINTQYRWTQVLPQSVFVFLIGIGFSAMASTIDPLGRFGRAILALQEVHPHVILYILLPPLLYESAASMDYHVFQKIAWQALWLAGPVVFIGTAVLGSILYVIFPEEWGFDWWNSLLLSSILCATDPVAVVASLQVLGAPRRLSVLIDGEALLNDATAFVLFLVFQKVAAGEDSSFLSAFLEFLRLSVGGVVTGLIIGILVVILLHRTISTVLEIAIVLVGIFGSFFISDALLGESGVLAVVTMGLYMSKRGKYALSPMVEEPLEVIMDQLSFISVSLIFFISGVVTYVKIFEDVGLQLGYDAEAWGYLLLIYLLLNLLRMALIFGSLPFLSHTGYHVTPKEALIMVWGGLRGAVSLALALLLEDNQNIATTEYVSFFVIGIVLLTLVINGTTSKPLYNYLDIYPVNRYRKVLFRSAMDELETSIMLPYWTHVAEDHLYKYADHNCLSALVPDLRNVRIVDGNLQFFHIDSVREVFRDHFAEDSGKEFPLLPVACSPVIRNSFSEKSLNSGYGIELEDIPSPVEMSKSGIDHDAFDEDDDMLSALPGRILSDEELAHDNPLERSHYELNPTKSFVVHMIGLARDATFESVEEGEKAEQIVHSLFSMVKASYHHQYDGMELDDEVLSGLVESASIGDESTYVKPVMGMDCETYFQPHFEAEWKSFDAEFLQRSRYVSASLWNYVPIAKKFIEFEWVFHSIQGIGGFIRSHVEARKKVMEELPVKLEFPLMQENSEKAINALRKFERRHPRSHGVVKTILVAKYLLRMKKASLLLLMRDGLIEKGEYLNIVEFLDHRLRELTTCKHDPILAQIAIGSLQAYPTEF